MELPILNDLIVIFGLSTLVLFLFTLLRIPPIIGFFLTGILAGPYGFAWINAVHEVDVLAEIGVVLLLFTIGVEFSLANLLQIRRSVLLGGACQVFGTIGLTYLAVRILGIAAYEAVFLGFFISLSSTAIVLNLLKEQAQIDSPHGRTVLAILIFQDLIVIPMLLFIPFLAGTGASGIGSLFSLLGKGVGILTVVYTCAKWVVPNFLYGITQTRNRQVFLLSILMIGLSVAWLTAKAGLSLGLGAFLAGLIISESEYSHQAMGELRPFLDLFTGFFFVSLGMLLDVGYVVHHVGIILLCTLGIGLLKSLAGGFASGILAYPLRTTLLVGLLLGQIGEFSFILAKSALTAGLISADRYQLLLSVSLATMALTPFIAMGAPRIVDWALQLPISKPFKTGLKTEIAANETALPELKDHLIIVGFGLNGKNVACAARAAGIPYIVLEMNPVTVRQEIDEPIIFGDAAHEAVLQHVHIREARIMVVAISDPAATQRITRQARAANPAIHLIVRTRFLQEMETLYRLGADEVIPEEFETSVEIFTRVLAKYLTPRQEIEKLIREIRSHGYEMLRSASYVKTDRQEIQTYIPAVEISAVRIPQDCEWVNKTLAEIDLRNQFEVTAAAIERKQEFIANPAGSTRIQTEDRLVLLGLPEKIAELCAWISGTK